MTEPKQLTPSELEQVSGGDYRYTQDSPDHPFNYLPPAWRPILL